MNIDLQYYIDQARKSGMEDNKIREGLLQSGWPVSSVEEAIMKVPAVGVPELQPKVMMSKSLAVIFTITVIVVAGYFAGAYYMANYQNLSLWPFEAEVPVPTSTPRPSSVATPDPTLSWQTYRNEEYGFEFKYPSYFSEQEITWQSKDALVMLVDTKEFSDYSGFIKVGIADGKIDKSEFISTGYLTNPDLILYNKKNNIKFSAPAEEIINSIRWYKFIGEEIGDCFASYYQIEHNNKIIELAFTACEYYPQAFLNRDFKLQNKILSTFKFLEPTDNTSTWKIYRNDEYGFEVQYPTDWSVDSIGGVPVEKFKAPIFQTTDCVKRNVRCGTMQIEVRELALSEPGIPKDYWQKHQAEPRGNSIEILDEYNSKIDGVEAYNVVYNQKNSGNHPGGQIHKDTIFIQGYKVYLVSYYEGYYQDNYGIKSINDWQLSIIFNQILSTFRFTK